MLFVDRVHLHDRCVAVFVLMLVSLRARPSDAHRIAKFIIMLAQPSVVVSSSAVHSDLRTPTPNKGRALCYPLWVLVNSGREGLFLRVDQGQSQCWALGPNSYRR
jgi:hypothetical protein